MIRRGGHVAGAGILFTVRIRRRLLASALTCAALIAAYQNETSSARAVPNEIKDAEISKSAATANGEQPLSPGEFRFTTGLDREPQHIFGSVTCDTRDGVHRIRIGDPYAGGLELGISPDESTLKYVDLGNRGGVYLALFNDGDEVFHDADPQGRPSTPPGTVHKTGGTYFTSGYATGTTADQQSTGLYFEISVACP